MTAVKLKFRMPSKEGQEGTLYYSISHCGVAHRVITDYHIFPHEWNRRTSTINIDGDVERQKRLRLLKSCIEWEMRQYRQLLFDISKNEAEMGADEFCETIRKVPRCKTVFAFMQEQIAKKAVMQCYGTVHTYENAYCRFREFRECRDLTFDDITSELVEQYEAWLVRRRLRQNTVRLYIRTLRTFYRRAVDVGLTTERDVFKGFHLAFVKTAKRAVSEKSIRSIARLPLPEGSMIAFARDMFMFSFYMRGMPFVDIAYLRKSDLRHGILCYCRRKTNRFLSVEWEAVQQEIVDKYSHLHPKSPYMLPILRQDGEDDYRQYIRVHENINRNLKKIGKMVGLKIPLTTYVARHSWASLARDIDIPISVISEGLGHNSCSTTQIYLSAIDTSRVNVANRKIIGRIRRDK